MRDGQGEILVPERRWLRHLVLRAGQPVVPTLRIARPHGAGSRRVTQTVTDCAVNRVIATAIA